MWLVNSPIAEYNTLSKSILIPKDWEYDHLIESDIIGNGTHAFMMSYFLTPRGKSLEQGNLVLGDFPYAGYLSDKKWYLNEAFVIFNLTFISSLTFLFKITMYNILHSMTFHKFCFLSNRVKWIFKKHFCYINI